MINWANDDTAKRHYQISVKKMSAGDQKKGAGGFVGMMAGSWDRIEYDRIESFRYAFQDLELGRWYQQ